MPHLQRCSAIIATMLFFVGVSDMSNHVIGFESTQTGAAPEGWTSTLTGSGDPKWTVESDETAPSRSKVLKQSGRATYPLLLKNDSSIKDGFVEIKFKAVAGSQDRAAGIVWRAKDANNYYVTRANALEDNVVPYKTVTASEARSTSSAAREDTEPMSRFRPTPGTACVSTSAARASASPSMANNCSRSRIQPSPVPAGSDCGLKPIA
ncbi:bll8072 [Bradyrhizobium diazoefficiens USDA 110]|uniref:Bll8072 protein n=2 Tax=Bradyrhizobium diazoefficiens TaxID=1355477 RepID=Q89BS6_BRADU|nr:hypothetical protein Bdiaspc4_42735 [Bradyrhizobium diazoefficiens]BAC53337.1 bll8072 [Bradyrhizobium diazoefficiens USDA 110]